MGSSSSKFRKHLSNGDEVAAIHLYNNNSDLRKGLDPNCSYGDSHNHDTPLHYASKHGMKSLLRIFLHDHSGNPNKTNAKKQTSLHCICMEKSEISQFYPVQRKRRDCLTLLLKWRGASLKDGEKEKVDLAAIDEENNTALHYAAASGLKHCVETLVQFGAPLFMENNDQLTPCDSAEKGGHGEIALFLESKMVFCNVSTEEEGEGDVISIVETEEYSGLRTQDLQEAKDQLLVETADMLCVPLFTAEALLRNHEWSREMLLEAWMSDALACCNKSGVIPPPSLYCDKPQVQESLVSPTKKELAGTIIVCDICTESFKEEEDPVHMSCDHQFCRCCWGGYLDLKIQEGDAHHITCPAYQCDRLVPVELIENIVSRDMARRYLQFDIEAFVDSNPNIKWCPYPACGRAVKLPELEDRTTGLSINKTLPSDTSRAVDCGNGHYFCWDCMGDAHEPSSCENWTKWYKKIAEIRPEEMDGTEEQTMTAANCLWLVTNSKPCPNCKSPIQKNEGCNHMKCSKCKHDFCWVCLDQWKRHNSSTGGYFKCNRYEAVKVVQEQTQKAQTEAEDKNLKMQELNKFVHYYTRFKNHENSFKLEEPLLNTTKSKMMKLAEAVTDVASANAETQFVEHAVQQLLKARRVLKCSYVYGYYLDGPGYKKIVFEFMQTELEECTEILSQMVNRLYLRTPRKRIIEQAQIVQRKRHEFILAISKGLVPPETPPGLRKHRRRRYSMDIEDEELRKAILASIQEVDPANPWIKDASGRHTNVMAVLDWPDSDDSDSDNYYTTQQGRCQRKNCKKPKAKNPRTDEVHQYCSRQCMYEEQLENPEKSEPVQEVIMDEQMDLLRALEMSRLQFLHDQGIITGDRSSISVRVSDSPNASDRSITTPNTNSSDIQFLHDQGIINQSWGSISYRVLDSPNASDISTTTPSTKSPDLQAPLRDTRQKSPRSRQKSPKQKSPGSRQKGKGKGKKSVQAAMEELDLEIQRVLEISSISPSELEASMKMLGEQQNTEQLSNPLRQKSRYDDTSSPCVQSVPNKSVEDLYHDDCLNCIPGERILPTPNSEEQRNALDMHLPSTSGCNPLRASLTSPAAEKLPSDDMKASPYLPPMSNNRQSSSSFGIIKDLSVSNLHVDVNDKTKDFQGKSFNFLMDQRSKSGNSSSGSLRLASFESPKEMEGCEMSDIFLSGDPKGAPTNQKDKKRETMLSVIAANTPGDDEDNLFVLVSPAESHVDHTMSYGSGESQSENAFLSPEEISQSEIPSEELHHGNTDFSNDVWTPMPTYIQDLAEGTGDSTEQFMHMDALNENYQRTVERSQETENVIENLWNTNQNTSDNNNIAQENIEEEESISTNSRNCDRNVYRDQATALSAMSEPFTSNDPITDDDIIDNGVNSLLRSLQLDELSTFSELEDIRPVSDNYGNYERESEVSSSITRRVMPPSDERGEADGAEEERGESFFV